MFDQGAAGRLEGLRERLLADLDEAELSGRLGVPVDLTAVVAGLDDAAHVDVMGLRDDDLLSTIAVLEQARRQLDAACVRAVGELDARDIPEIVVFNKSDLADDDQRLLIRGLEPTGVFVSARTGEGIDELLERIAEVLPAPEVEVTLLVPYDRGEIISRLHVQGRVISTDYREDGTLVKAMVHPARMSELSDFIA
jgi:50S ribosomal subunit-associated GTPase HflX